jgi:hypothetical protein
MTRLWKPGPGGALAPYAAQCRPRCAAARPARLPALAVGTAVRPGRCAACPRDIVPGDKTARAGGQDYHYECAPAEAPQAQPQRRERARAHRA